MTTPPSLRLASAPIRGNSYEVESDSPPPKQPSGTEPPTMPPVDARIARLETILETIVADRREERADTREHRARMELKFDSLDTDVKGLEQRISEKLSNVKFFVLTTAIGAALATVFGIAAFNATVLSNMVASFESGKNTVTAIDAATTRLETVQRAMSDEQRRQEKQFQEWATMKEKPDPKKALGG